MAPRLMLCATGEAVAPWAAAMAALARAEAARWGAWLHENEAAFYGRFHGAHGATVVAERGGALVGFALLGFAPALASAFDEEIARLGLDRARCGSLVQSCLDPALRGGGLGQRLVALRIEAARARGIGDLWATAHPDNHAALATLRRVGGEVVAVRRVYSTQVLRAIVRVPLGADSTSTVG